MTILNRGSGPFPHLLSDARKYRALADDLERIAHGEHPDPDVLRNAPHLFDWQVLVVPVPHLLGTVFGHPEIADGRLCRTSQLFTLEPETGYARTLSRFYRLDPPSPASWRRRSG